VYDYDTLPQRPNSPWSLPVTVNVVPAYRVIAKYAKQAQALPQVEGLSFLEQHLRDYVRHLLADVSPSLVELGQRSAVSQLGDPDMQTLIDAITRIDSANPRALAEEVLARCGDAFDHPSLESKVLLLPGDAESRTLAEQMHGVLGFSLGSRVMVVFIWPTEGWLDWLGYTIAHEYAHLVRNQIFPRGISGGKLVFLDSKEPETLLDAMVTEGIADHVAMRLWPGVCPTWTDALDAADSARLWPRVQRRLGVSDPNEIRRVLFGDNDRIPAWTGFTFGYRVVNAYLRSHPKTKLVDMAAVCARDIYEASGFAT
jgi:uncharacterized protein YjaZ